MNFLKMTYRLLSLAFVLGTASCSTQPSVDSPTCATPSGDQGQSTAQDPKPDNRALTEADRASTRSANFWDVPYPEPFDRSQLSVELPFISVNGKDFVDDSGNVVVFRGLNISDPDKLSQTGHWSRDHFEVIKSWGANVVRIPVHPIAWKARGAMKYFELLDEAVSWANSQQLYLIIDWHSIGNLKTGLFQHPMYDTTLQETLSFWRQVAFRYKGVSTVAFYELFNEPTLYKGNLGRMTWSEWKSINEEMIDIIYSLDKNVIPLVAGLNWAYDLSPVSSDPIEREGIAYVSHPYPQKVGAPFTANWERDFGFVADKYPLFATEIGYMPADSPHAHVPAIDEGPYGPRITDYLGKRGASWVAWCFDPDWGPPLIADWSYTPTKSGAHFRKVMLEAHGR